MRPNANSRRSRGRGGRKSGNPRNQTFDSNGPGARVRGNASQIYEKYQQLARDAASSGDRVGAENFLQHAEHYYRLMTANGTRPDMRSNADDGDRGSDESGQIDDESAQAVDLADEAEEQAANDGDSDRDGEPEWGGAANGRRRRTRKPNGARSDDAGADDDKAGVIRTLGEDDGADDGDAANA
jgi:hypothetical protein